MTTRLRTARITLCLALFAALLAGGAAVADETLQDYAKTIKERMPKLLKLKRDGAVGETRDGKVAVVKDADADDEVTGLVQAENADRAGVYAIIAKKEGTSPEKVGRLNGLRNFRKAEKGAWLRGADGKWFRKTTDAGAPPEGVEEPQ
ncbi:MAG: YdbL family protein [Planctomycetota bacterium]